MDETIHDTGKDFYVYDHFRDFAEKLIRNHLGVAVDVITSTMMACLLLELNKLIDYSKLDYLENIEDDDIEIFLRQWVGAINKHSTQAMSKK